MTAPTTVPVALAGRAYNILIGRGLIRRAGELISPLLTRPRVLVVSDETVAALHLAPLNAALEETGITASALVLPPGERTKTFPAFERLCDELLERKIERSDVIIALGGGVIGDLAGFAASVIKRGVGLVQIPTTLLAQVDSSVGGKTGIDTRQGKNLIGAFHQPRLVLADIATLDTLPARELRAGYAEVVKYGLLGDAEFFAWCEAHASGLLAGDDSARIQAVETSCRMKAAIVARDETETGDRALLNLGHTFGHALEAAVGFGEALRHGEAVAIGMVLAARLSAALGLMPAAEADRI
ncbi:MAG: 3-dehydroquinate synthase, partial [Alphaproteobacteria bacterium]|nr:3-dehydroquinate synthase [Alphaproteobacteria bacterium]